MVVYNNPLLNMHQGLVQWAGTGNRGSRRLPVAFYWICRSAGGQRNGVTQLAFQKEVGGGAWQGASMALARTPTAANDPPPLFSFRAHSRLTFWMNLSGLVNGAWPRPRHQGPSGGTMRGGSSLSHSDDDEGDGLSDSNSAMQGWGIDIDSDSDSASDVQSAKKARNPLPIRAELVQEAVDVPHARCGCAMRL